MRVTTLIGLALSIAVVAAPAAQAAGFGCSASAGRITVLGQKFEPVTANAGGSTCVGDSKTLTGQAAGLPAPLSIDTLVASTAFHPEKKGLLASGGIADLAVASLPSLPIDLPAVAVPAVDRAAVANALKATLDLAAIKSLVPTLPTNLTINLPVDLLTNLQTNLPTNLAVNLPVDLVTNLLTNLPTNLAVNLPVDLVTNLPTNLPTTLVLNLLNPLLDTPLEVLVQNNANAVTNAANIAQNAANTAQNAANAATNAANAATNAANTITNAANTATNAANAITNAANLALNAANTATNAANAITNAANLAQNAANAATNAANTITNAANTATNAANAALNAVRNAIPDAVSIDGASTVDAALAALLPNGKLPNVELLHVRNAVAYAAGSCQSGKPVVTGASTVGGISVLGQGLPVDQVIDRTLSLIDTASIDPSKVAVPTIDLGLTQAQTDLIATIPAAKAALDAAVAAAKTLMQQALDGIHDIKVLDPTVAQVKVVPGQRTETATSIIQQALNITVSIAGQNVLDAIIGEAKTSSAGVDCSKPVTDPGTPTGETPTGSGTTGKGTTGKGTPGKGTPGKGTPGKGTTGKGTPGIPGIGGSTPVADPNTPTGAALDCTTRRLVLVDVLERSNGVKLFGVADPALAGKTVSIVFNATGQTVAHAKVARDGSFDTVAPLPPASVRDTNDARYMAKLGRDESINLKLSRRMVLRSMTSRDGKVTITGRVLPPLGKPVDSITLTRRVSCNKEVAVTSFMPDSDGRFSVTVDAPKGIGTAVYRMTTEVRYSATGTGLFKTYTLPRAVELHR